MPTWIDTINNIGDTLILVDTFFAAALLSSTSVSGVVALCVFITSLFLAFFSKVCIHYHPLWQMDVMFTRHVRFDTANPASPTTFADSARWAAANAAAAAAPPAVPPSAATVNVAAATARGVDPNLAAAAAALTAAASALASATAASATPTLAPLVYPVAQAPAILPLNIQSGYISWVIWWLYPPRLLFAGVFCMLIAMGFFLFGVFCSSQSGHLQGACYGLAAGTYCPVLVFTLVGLWVSGWPWDSRRQVWFELADLHFAMNDLKPHWDMTNRRVAVY